MTVKLKTEKDNSLLGMGDSGKNMIQHLKKMKKYDGLAIAALGLNIFAVYTTSNIRSLQELLVPMANQEILVIQASAVMAAIYSIEYFGDSEDNSRRHPMPGEDDGKGLIAMITGLMEEGFVGEIIDAASIGAVFLGYSYLSENAAYGTSITQVSTNPEVIAIQLSVLMMANFGIVLVSDLLSKSS